MEKLPFTLHFETGYPVQVGLSIGEFTTLRSLGWSKPSRWSRCYSWKREGCTNPIWVQIDKSLSLPRQLFVLRANVLHLASFDEPVCFVPLRAGRAVVHIPCVLWSMNLALVVHQHVAIMFNCAVRGQSRRSLAKPCNSQPTGPEEQSWRIFLQQLFLSAWTN